VSRLCGVFFDGTARTGRPVVFLCELDPDHEGLHGIPRRNQWGEVSAVQPARPAPRPDIEAIAARAAAATPERWEPFFTRHGDPYVVEEGWGPGRQDIGGGSRTVCDVSTGPPDYGQANAMFIGHARQDVPDLVAYVLALEKRLGL
jgi:hypothetical protein